MIYIIDHHDSFTQNVVHQFQNFDEVVCTNFNKINQNKLKKADIIVFSPGPGAPKDYPVSSQIYKKYKGNNEILEIQHVSFKVYCDGSGLSKSNRISANTIVKLLGKIRNNPTYESIYDGLPVGGITGTLQKRFLETAPHAVGHVHAKTGWVNRSVTMAGYVDDGETEYAFAILADGITPTFTSRNRARAAMDRLLGVIVKGIH